MTAQVHTIRLPEAVGVEPDPDRPGEGRLVVYGTDDLHRLRAEIDIILVGGPRLDDVLVTRREDRPRSPFELGTGPCPVPGCVTPGSHVHRGGDPAPSVVDKKTWVEQAKAARASAGVTETAASTVDWSTQDWISWLRRHGVRQAVAVEAIRAHARARGEEPPTGITPARLRPEYRDVLIDLAAARAAAAASAAEPW